MILHGYLTLKLEGIQEENMKMPLGLALSPNQDLLVCGALGGSKYT